MDDRSARGEPEEERDETAPAERSDPAEDLFDDELDAFAEGRSEWTAWGNLWQVPAILLSIILIALGIAVASHRAPTDDFGGALDQVSRLIGAGMFDDAQVLLETTLLENLELATGPERARYHATVADWLAESQVASGVSTPENNLALAEQYGRAVELGMVLSPVRHERWGNALIDTGEIAAARERLAELEGIGVTDEGGADARVRRNRLLRRLVERSLASDDFDADAVLAGLEQYRADPMLGPQDVAWIVARQAELRLESNEAAEAVERLLIDMRRLEDHVDELAEGTFSELYLLLGRAYYDLGRYADAEFNLARAAERVQGAEYRQAEVLLYLGRLDVALGRVDAAHEIFDEIIRDFVGADAHLPATLGRAETASIRGDHEASLTDFRAVVARLTAGEHRRGLTRRGVAASLTDRHDAALTLGDLDLALRYVSLAESLFSEVDVPVDVLYRIASTSRQIADDVMREGLEAVEGPRTIDEVDPEIRHLASTRYERAGAYFIRHAKTLTAVPGADRQWADSLWLSGDSYDLAGHRDIAIKHFIEYIAGRPIDDPRRAEVTFRLAQAHQAELDLEAAAAAYEKVIEEHPRSPFGTRSHVPLARCYVGLDRGPDAERQLLQVVDGRQGAQNPIMPDAVDYRDALIELGRLYYDGGEFVKAIERLTSAASRYPDDPRLNDIRYRLADSYRRRSQDLRAANEAQTTDSPEEVQRRDQLAREHLETALDLFSMVCDGYGQQDEQRLNRTQRDALRHAMSYRADCAFTLGQTELAAQFFDQVARRYSDHHSSMHALVQIINAYMKLGRTKDAEIAHHNAMIRLRQLPDDAFDDPGALMDRDAWEQWLRNRPLGSAASATGSGN
ncbi:MAG: tetratricopeptide repeat protein [Planctomycetes bacterium]|nr:tetratricopeptide repeat protein [Planctomycetota bacterium]